MEHHATRSTPIVRSSADEMSASSSSIPPHLRTPVPRTQNIPPHLRSLVPKTQDVPPHLRRAVSEIQNVPPHLGTPVSEAQYVPPTDPAAFDSVSGDSEDDALSDDEYTKTSMRLMCADHLNYGIECEEPECSHRMKETRACADFRNPEKVRATC